MAAKVESKRRKKDSPAEVIPPVVGTVVDSPNIQGLDMIPNPAYNPSPSSVKVQITMSDTPSIVSYSEDVSQQDAPAPLPVREYIGTVKTAEVKDSQKTGKQYLQINFHVGPDQYPADFTDGNPDGETLSWMRTPISDDPRGRFAMKSLCQILGVVSSKQVDLNDMIGKDAKLVIKHSQYEGQNRAEIAKLLAVD